MLNFSSPYFFAISGLLNAIVATIFGLIVFLRIKKNKANILFVLMSGAVALWSFAYWLWLLSSTSSGALFWIRIVSIGSVLIPVFYLHWIFAFLKKEETKTILFSYVLTGIFLLFSFSSLFIKSVGPKLYFSFWPTPGFLYSFYLAFAYFLFAGYGIYLLFYSLRNASVEQRAQIKLILIGSLLGFGGGATNFLLWYNIPIPPIGNLLVFFYPVLLAYAILKHHLFSIKVISTELFSVILFLLLFVRFLLSGTTGEFVLNGTIAFSFALFGILLIRSVWKEVRLREQLAKTTEDLKSANIELRRLDKAKSEFLSIASHQLRTPLTAIKGYSSMLLGGDYGETSKEVSGIIEKIFLSAKRLAVIVDDFLDISKIESGKMKYDIRKFDLKKAVKNVVDDFVTNNQKARDLSLQFNWEDKNFTTKSDPDKITQVISNVIDNALKYTTKGRVKIYLSKDEEQNKFLIKTEDTGIGISKETLARLFQKFTRAKEISKLHTDGSGLGLYVAKKIMEDLGGRIWAKSPGKNKGSSFFIELPVS